MDNREKSIAQLLKEADIILSTLTKDMVECGLKVPPDSNSNIKKIRAKISTTINSLENGVDRNWEVVYSTINDSVCVLQDKLTYNKARKIAKERSKVLKFKCTAVRMKGNAQNGN